MCRLTAPRPAAEGTCLRWFLFVSTSKRDQGFRPSCSPFSVNCPPPPSPGGCSERGLARCGVTSLGHSETNGPSMSLPALQALKDQCPVWEPRRGRAAGTEPSRDPTPPSDLTAGRASIAGGFWGRRGLQLSPRRPGQGLMDGDVMCAEWTGGAQWPVKSLIPTYSSPPSPEFALQIREGHGGHVCEASLGPEQPTGAGRGAVFLVGRLASWDTTLQKCRGRGEGHCSQPCSAAPQ